MQKALIMHFIVIILANDSITTINIRFFKSKKKKEKRIFQNESFSWNEFFCQLKKKIKKYKTKKSSI